MVSGRLRDGFRVNGKLEGEIENVENSSSPIQNKMRSTSLQSKMTGRRYPRPSPPTLHVLSSPFLPQVAGLPSHHVAHQSGEDHSGVAPEHELLEGQAFIKELQGNEGEGS